VNLLKGAVLESIDEYKPAESQSVKQTNRWTQDEIVMVIQGWGI